MGRSSNKQRRQEKRVRDSVTSDQWNASTKPEVLHYLLEYRRGCALYYQTLHAEHLNRHVLSKKDVIESPLRSKASGKSPENEGLRIIGGISFPVLSEEVFQKPYLLLPSQLSSKQRRFMHHCCVHADLFHDSINDQLDRRQMVISCYADGFDYLPTPRSKSEPVITALYRYKPWYCRRYIDRKEETRVIRDSIWKYIDQPGLCLRDHHDRLEYRSGGLSVHTCTNIFATDAPDSFECMHVETAAQMKQCICELLMPSVYEIGFDLESFQDTASTQITCVLQLTSNLGKDYIIDVLSEDVWDEICGLKPLFSNPNVVKVGHAIGGLDVQSLHRDFGIFVVNAFDTYEAAKLLPIQQHGLAALLEYYNIPDTVLHQRLKDLYQNCDWRTRPMTAEMIQYARADVHCLLKLRQLLLRDLVLVNNPYIWESPSSEMQNNLIQPSADVNPCPDVLDFISQIANFEDDETTTGYSTAVQSVFTASSQKCDKFVSPSSSSLLDATDDDEVDNVAGANVGPRVISAAELRYQPLLMTCISLSQERCLKLSSKDPREESFWKHDLFLSLTREPVESGTSVGAPSAELLQELVHWRNGWAEELECFPSFLVPLDFLIYVAWKRPLTEAGLRWISQELPPWLKESVEGRQSLLTAVLQYRLKNGSMPISTATICYYSNMKREPDHRFVDESTVKWYSDEKIVTLIVVASLSVGILLAVSDALQLALRKPAKT
jgi:3'-5' exonuclease